MQRGAPSAKAPEKIDMIMNIIARVSIRIFTLLAGAAFFVAAYAARRSKKRNCTNSYFALPNGKAKSTTDTESTRTGRSKQRR